MFCQVLDNQAPVFFEYRNITVACPCFGWLPFHHHAARAIRNTNQGCFDPDNPTVCHAHHVATLQRQTFPNAQPMEQAQSHGKPVARRGVVEYRQQFLIGGQLLVF